ncbi:MAG: flavin reductase family protein [Bacteroidales bacterium]|nr:flavin reductase family protein [Bacteroidales bacterium]
MMKKINPLDTTVPEFHKLMLGSVAPRPIAFASTIDKNGNPNVSPFSFFNAFGANPPTLVFSPSRRGRDNTTKHTFENLKEIPEVVINVVNYDIVQQVSLSSTEYPKGVNEFIKAGLTPLASELVKPFRVKESPVQFECRVNDIIETGDQGGAGNLVICEILLMHIDENVFDNQGSIDPNKIDLVGRMGGNFYCRTNGNSVFTVEKPLQRMGIGIDALPDGIRLSEHLSGNDLGKMGNIERLPSPDEIKAYRDQLDPAIAIPFTENGAEKKIRVIAYAKNLLEKEKALEALTLLMAFI